MKSPFAGMDPYLEKHWGDVHASLIIYARDLLQPQLPGKLFARVEERVVVEPEEGEDRSIYPDVRVVEKPEKAEGRAVLEKDVAVAEPVLVEYAEPATETYINIFDPGSRDRLVTVIEFLSRSNKFPGESQDQYRRKQRELKASKVSLVEVDLLRSGKRVLSLPVARIPRRIRTLYQVCVRRGWKPSPLEIYPAPLERRLPILRIPLRSKDEDVRLDLQAILDQAYRNGAYHATINYQEPPEPPLQGKDAAWAEARIRKASK